MIIRCLSLNKIWWLSASKIYLLYHRQVPNLIIMEKHCNVQPMDLALDFTIGWEGNWGNQWCNLRSDFRLRHRIIEQLEHDPKINSRKCVAFDWNHVPPWSTSISVLSTQECAWRVPHIPETCVASICVFVLGCLWRYIHKEWKHRHGPKMAPAWSNHDTSVTLSKAQSRFKIIQTDFQFALIIAVPILLEALWIEEAERGYTSFLESRSEARSTFAVTYFQGIYFQGKKCTSWQLERNVRLDELPDW